jgi:hypothetical protein
MKLIIGSIYIGVESYDALRLIDKDGQKIEFELSELYELPSGRLVHYLALITEIVVGFSGITHLDFLVCFPEVTKIRVMDSTVKNIDGLEHYS